MLELELRQIEDNRIRFAKDLTWVLARQYGNSHGLRMPAERGFTPQELMAKAIELEATDQPVSVWLLDYAALLERNDRDAERARAQAFAYYRRTAR